MTIRNVIPLAVAGLLATGTAAAEPTTVATKQLSLDAALKMAQGTVLACRAKGIQVGVTVVDRSGTPQVMLRDSLAPPVTETISRMKAVTAINFTAPTSALARRADTPIGRVPGLVMSAGGVPVSVAGAVLGAIGVSGAPDGAVDEECAVQGAKPVIEEIELGG
ncbi:MAG: heme-binding protein [Gammaproteobacteria bacterium]|jgi:uncharacterized protein GlcG (DUF336 family)|nr:heme-binding protein [Gammaproteobacteria bacterium]